MFAAASPYSIRVACAAEAVIDASEYIAHPEATQDIPTPQAGTDDAVPRLVVDGAAAASGGVDMDTFQQIADTAFGAIDPFLPVDVAEQLRGQSLAVLATLVAVAVVLITGTLTTNACFTYLFCRASCRITPVWCTPSSLFGVCSSNTAKCAHPLSVQHEAHPTYWFSATELVTYAVALNLLRSTLKEKSVLLCGPMDAGKTTLFHALQGRRLPAGTVTSMMSSETVLNVPVRYSSHRLSLFCDFYLLFPA